MKMSTCRWLSRYSRNLPISIIVLVMMACNVQKAFANSAGDVTANVTVTTEVFPAGNLAQGLIHQIVYVLKMEVINSEVALNNFSIITNGTYDSNDFTGYSLFRNTTPALSGSTAMDFENTMSGAGETLNFSSLGNFIFTPGTYYLLMTVSTTADATDNNTIHLNGMTNPANLIFNDAIYSNNQSNNAGVQTIAASDVSLFTIAQPASNIVQGSINNVTYILEMHVGSISTSISNFAMITSGNYDVDDISSIRLARNTVPVLPGSTNLGSDISITGSGELVSIGFSAQTFTVGTHYLIVVVAVNSFGTDNNTIHFNGLTNPAMLTFVNSPNIQNSQSNNSGIKTIQAGEIMLSTEPLTAGNVFQGSFSNVSYILRMDVSVTNVTLNNFQMVSSGNYDIDDLTNVSLRRNTIPSLSGSTSLGSDITLTGSGENISINPLSAFFAIGTHYLIVTVNISNSGTDEHTIHFDGNLNPAVVAFTTAANITSSQSNNAGIRTIQAGEITLTTESVLPSNILQGSLSNVSYIMKLEVSITTVTLSNFQMTTSGTYDNNDITAINLRRNSIPGFAGSTNIGSDVTLTGAGENVSIASSPTLQPGTHYLIVTVSVHSGGTDENTIHFDGSLNPSILSFSTAPIVTNNQSNNAGIQTIQAGEVTLSTEHVLSATVFQGSSFVVSYMMRMDVSVASVTLNNFQMITAGTYDNNDLSLAALYRNTIPSFTGSTHTFGSDNSFSGSGENISIPVSSTFAPGTHYLILTVFVANNATDENTFHFDGNLNPAVVSFSTSPFITNNQSNNAGIQTIQAGEVTISTEPVAAGNMPQGSFSNVAYIMRLNVSTASVTLSNFQIITSGNYDNNDFTLISIRRNSIPSFTGSSEVGSDFSILGNGENITIVASNFNTFVPGTHYLLVTTNVRTSGTDENTIHLDGSLNPAVLTFSTSPFVTSNQSNLAGIKTIQAADITLTTVAVPAKNILQGSVDNISYILKMVVATTGVTTNNLQFITNGTYDNNDLVLASLRRHGSPVFNGSVLLSTDNTFSGTGESIFFNANFNLTPGVYYYLVTLNLSGGATNGNTIHFNGQLNPAVITFSTSPNITNNQSNLAGIQRIGNPFYQDADNDGYGNFGVVTYATNPPDGYVADFNDCDDTNEAIHPDAEEICDDLDNDCDGFVDDDDDSLTGPFWYADADQDGYGDPNDFLIACIQPDGYVSDASDECPEDSDLSIAGPCGCGIEVIDSDEDGTPDCIDECPDDPEKIYQGYCGCGAPETDRDEDSVPDCVDVCPDDPNKYWDEGICGCGVSDSDTDEDGTPDCNDECPDDPNYTEAGACGCGIEETDTDEDGTPDCIDTEECDGADNDGDGLIDDEDPDVTGQTTWYADVDEDGYGDEETTLQSCEQPSGYVAIVGDCKDDEPSINPGSLEACNDVDDDCDGLIDDDDPDIVGQLEWYQDNDDDGYGNPNLIEHACIKPEGYVGLAGDCDDADPAINPDAEEICNGIDDDCNDRVDESPDCIENDEDGDGISDDEDNCKLYSNPDQADSDCDAVGDVCDVCPGGDDSVDNNNDGRPDCKYPPPYAQIIDDWKCGNKKVFICHISNNGLEYAQTTCINYNALIPHINHGDYLGPCGNASCPTTFSAGDMTIDATSTHAPGAIEFSDEVHEEIETTPNDEMYVDPNPAYEELRVLIPSFKSEGQLKLYSLTGEIMLIQKVKGDELLLIDLSTYASGLYMIEVRTKDGFWQKKILKME